MKRKLPQGISSVLILGIIAILVTIVIPLLSRTVVDIRISKQQEEQARAFSVAESALEKYLIGELSPPPAGSEISYTAMESDSGGEESFLYPQSIEKNLPITIWLVDHDDAAGFDSEADFLTTSSYQGGTVSLFWGTPGTPADAEAPAIETTLFYQIPSGGYKVQRDAFDPFVTRGSGFDPADSAGGLPGYSCGSNYFEFKKDDMFVPCDSATSNVCYTLRIRLLHSPDSHPVCISAPAGNVFPIQANCREVVATVETSGVSSRVQRCLFYKDFPAIFDFVLYSDSDLKKDLP